MFLLLVLLWSMFYGLLIGLIKSVPSFNLGRFWLFETYPVINFKVNRTLAFLPFGVENTRLVGALISMGTEVVALGLGQVLGQTIAAVAIEIIQR